jgi:hypothetical protein
MRALYNFVVIDDHDTQMAHSMHLVHIVCVIEAIKTPAAIIYTMLFLGLNEIGTCRRCRRLS